MKSHRSQVTISGIDKAIFNMGVRRLKYCLAEGGSRESPIEVGGAHI